jgi:hypothetical protein
LTTYGEGDTVCVSEDPAAPCEDTCFIAGTKVLMQDGTEKPIEAVKKGEFVQGSERSNKVIKTLVLQHDGWLYSMNGSKYFVTQAHPFMTKGGVWKAFSPEAAMKETPGLPVEQLKEGDILITQQGEVLLDKVDRIWKKIAVYNFVVDNSHDYYADGYLVHNKEAALDCASTGGVCPIGYSCLGGYCVAD